MGFAFVLNCSPVFSGWFALFPSEGESKKAKELAETGNLLDHRWAYRIRADTVTSQLEAGESAEDLGGTKKGEIRLE